MYSNCYENFRKNLPLLIKNAGFETPASFAKALGCDTSTVSKWIVGKNSPNLEYICKILQVLDCDFWDLVS